MEITRPAYLEINLNNLQYNIDQIQNKERMLFELKGYEDAYETSKVAQDIILSKIAKSNYRKILQLKVE